MTIVGVNSSQPPIQRNSEISEYVKSYHRAKIEVMIFRILRILKTNN